MAKRRYAFTVEEAEGMRFEEFAAMRAAPAGSLAIVAIREYIERKESDRQRSVRRRKASGDDSSTEGALGQAAGSPGAIPEASRDSP